MYHEEVQRCFGEKVRKVCQAEIFHRNVLVLLASSIIHKTSNLTTCSNTRTLLLVVVWYPSSQYNRILLLNTHLIHGNTIQIMNWKSTNEDEGCTCTCKSKPMKYPWGQETNVMWNLDYNNKSEKVYYKHKK